MEKVKGVAYWASVHTPNKTYNDDGIYQIDLIISEEDQKKLKDLGLTLIEKPDGRVIFRPKRNALNAKTKQANPSPKVYDSMGQESRLEIGNGSEVEVAFSVFPYKRIKGNGADFAGVKIVKLIPYSREAKDVFTFEEEPEQVKTPEVNPFD